jgi:hypothetical protein
MAATEEMKKVALDIRPDVVSLVPERPEELTTEGGLKVASNRKALAPHVKALGKAGIRTSIFIDTSLEEIKAAREIGVDLIEINTGEVRRPQGGAIREKALERSARPRSTAARSGSRSTAATASTIGTSAPSSASLRSSSSASGSPSWPGGRRRRRAGVREMSCFYRTQYLSLIFDDCFRIRKGAK